jgi:NAD(P)-dependent dehydrogenase (short-subunit alcohol dehydrogenase family)
MMFSLKNKNVLILGGAGYLATPVSKAIAKAGGNLIIADLAIERAKVLAEKLQTKYPDSKITAAGPVDTESSDAMSGYFQKIEEDFQHLDGMVCAISPKLGGAIDELTPELMNKHFKKHVTPMFILARAAKKLMKHDGSIILFSSMYGSVVPYPEVYFPPMEVNPLAYGMCKAAINQMVRYLAVTWGTENIRVNTVAPGPFPNPNSPANDASFVERLAQKTPMKRVGRQHEIAGTIIYLLSPESSYVTGQNIAVNGGWTVW